MTTSTPTVSETSHVAEMLSDASIVITHQRFIAAPTTAVWSALEALQIDDLALTRALARIRRFGRRTHGSILRAGPLRVLEAQPPHYVLAGAITRPWEPHPHHADVRDAGVLRDFDEPGWVKIAMDFTLESIGNSTLLATSTRVQPTDASAARRFAPYWRLIEPFSRAIRRDILRTVATSATSGRRP